MGEHDDAIIIMGAAAAGAAQESGLQGSSSSSTCPDLPASLVSWWSSALPTPEQLAKQLALTAPQLPEETVQEIIVLQLRLEGVARRMLTVIQDAKAKEEVS